MVLKVWSCAIETCEPRQGGNAAAISSYFDVPQGSQTRANCIGNAGVAVSTVRHDFFIYITGRVRICLYIVRFIGSGDL